MNTNLRRLLWQWRGPWLLLLASLCVISAVPFALQIGRIVTTLQTNHINPLPQLCIPYLHDCETYYARYGAYLSNLWRQLEEAGVVTTLVLILTGGTAVVGALILWGLVPKPSDEARAARLIQRRAEENPWKRRRHKPLKISGVYGRFWAAKSQMRGLFRESKFLAGRCFFLGNWGKRPLHLHPGFGGKVELDNILLVAPTGRGKGLMLKTNLAAWRGSAIVADLKGDMYDDLSHYLTLQGHQCFRVSVTGHSHRYDPFLEFEGELGLQAAAMILMGADKDGSNRIFADRAAIAVHAALLAARKLGVPSLPYLAELTRGGLRAFLEGLDAVDDPAVRQRVVDFLGESTAAKNWSQAGQDRFLQSCWSTLMTRLSPLLSESILAVTGGSDFRADDMRDMPTTVFLHFPKDSLEATLPLYQLVSESLIRGLTRNGEQRPEYKTDPVLWLCDEAHLLTPANLPAHINTLRDWGVSVVVVLQSTEQLVQCYGKTGAATLKAGCDTQIYYRPMDTETAKTISEMAGKMPFPQETRNENEKRRSVSYTLSDRPLIRPEAVREMQEHEIIIFAQGLPPIAATRLMPFDLGYGEQVYRKEGSRFVPRFNPISLEPLVLPQKPKPSHPQTPQLAQAQPVQEASETPSYTSLED
jgi:type IV secretory pathway TraG/TraD family ATPase VirD4